MRSRLLCTLLLVPALLSAQGRIDGVVYDSLVSKAPLAGATVAIRELNRYATTDDLGRFSIDSLAPRRYTVDVMHGVLDSLELQLPGVLVDLSKTTQQSVALGVPNARGLQRMLCTGPSATGSSVLIGTVRSLDGASPIVNASVDVLWRETTFDRSGVREQERHAVVRTANSGAFLLCGVPSDTDLRIAVTSDGFPVTTVDSRADSIGLRRAEIRLGAGMGSTRFVARGASGEPRPEATIRVSGMVELRTDSLGAAVATLPAGSHSAEVVALGFVPARFSFVVRTDSTSEMPVKLTRTVPSLTPVKVTGRYEMLNQRLVEFELRRKVGLGSFVGPRELAQITSNELSEALRPARGVRLVSAGPGLLWPNFRGGAGQCIPNFFVNGALFPVDGPRPGPRVRYPYTDLTASVPLENIVAIEVYASTGGIPAAYDRTSQNSCGSILIWTR